jgi:hypothetical protein
MVHPGPCQQIADTFDMITPHLLHRTAKVKIQKYKFKKMERLEGGVFKEKPN